MLPVPLPFPGRGEAFASVIIQIFRLAVRRQHTAADPAQFFMSLSGGDSRILLRYLQVP